MVSAQYWYRADTTCYSDMYVAAAISEFSPIPSPLKANIEIQERDTSDLFELLYELNREKLLPIYDWPVTTIPSTINEKEVHKLLESAPNVHSILDPEFPYTHYFYRFHSNLDVTMFNELGDPIYDADGQIITFPNDTVDLYFLQLTELRIHYLRTEDNAYRIHRIGLVGLDQYESNVELFWVRYDELLLALQVKGIRAEDQFWYNRLKQDDFKGFRYKQEPCDQYFSR